MNTCLHGIPVSEGIVICPASVLTQTVCTEYAKTIKDEDVTKEISRFREAVAAAINGLKPDQAQAATIGKVQADIIAAHVLILEDKALATKVEGKIRGGMSAEYAAESAIEEFASIFEAMKDEYMRERSGDIRDIGRRLMMNLTGQSTGAFIPSSQSIVVADDLMPSDTALFDQRFIRGMVTAKGGKTSHTAILARTMGIPAIAGIGSNFSMIKNGDLLIVDGSEGVVYVNPDQALINAYQERAKAYRNYRERLAGLQDIQTETKDGRKIEIAANIGKPEEVARVLETSAEGIGLFRTEFLFMDREKIPTEEEQFIAYKTVLEALPGKKVIIRTLDAGGDKELCYLNLPPEENPALGFRAIRICLAQKELFKTQLRALLRAGLYGDLYIMFPMISCLKEVQQAKQVLQEAAGELAAEGKQHAEALPLGIMVETPAAALMADCLAQEVNFFSIGTNDLVQYTLAVDRMNHQVAYLTDYFDPAVLKLIALTCQAAKKANIFVGMCGEMAGDPLALPLLLGLGLDELSMSPGSILQCKDRIRNILFEKAVTDAAHALRLTSAEQVRQYCKELQRSGQA